MEVAWTAAIPLLLILTANHVCDGVHGRHKAGTRAGNEEEESRTDEKLKYNCKCSFLEIYNEQITDLLEPSSTNLPLREDTRNEVYVETLTEREVGCVGDIIKLLMPGSVNRRVAATNMNRLRSRSHSVFTCIIESRWEKDSTSNLRLARLNLVDLAGSERQRTSGAEGERLKEAANINKSLSKLGLVIMSLVDLSHGKQRHVPYRDSRLTFLLQDSLGGNSKTMIVANVSPALCSANETLSTQKFAQRARLIQNNAVVNEDASGDVVALQHQIRLLKDELAVLKCQRVNRSSPFTASICQRPGVNIDDGIENMSVYEENYNDAQDRISVQDLRISNKKAQPPPMANNGSTFSKDDIWVVATTFHISRRAGYIITIILLAACVGCTAAAFWLLGCAIRRWWAEGRRERRVHPDTDGGAGDQNWLREVKFLNSMKIEIKRT